MLIEYNGEVNYAKLGMAMLEIASVADWGKTFAESCYTLEGDSVIILRASSIFERLEYKIAHSTELIRINNVWMMFFN